MRATNSTNLKISSVKIGPVAGIVAIFYFFFGLVYFFSVALRHSEYITFPLGILAPLVTLNLNLTFPRSTEISGAIFQILCCLASYTVTGWLTGATFVLIVNFIGKYFGGIPARFVAVQEKQPGSVPNAPIDNSQ